ncbi:MULTISPECIES: porin family protein [unclassified Janthinobacterium]|uniref:porin family protein n=1 Tax=unclassified Janthinobacterium TaxID=2610881 RepID=UPI0008897A30|nr:MULTISPECIES: porin family protein [unclassified Janthinobacterium]SDA40778.1 OmpA-OmpF porin, OOP family [Janthinobacterium sp. 551a]SFA84247.1 OmpA-OmpF porin, OOP family [Janthinobacterium sp. 344]
MKKFACSTLLAVAATSIVHAEGLYVGANVSPSSDGKIQYAAGGTTSQRGASGKALPFGVFAGYALTPDWALEGGYRASGGTTRFDLDPGYQLKLRASAAYLAARGTWQLDEDWSLFAKAGMARSRVEFSINGRNAPPGESANKTGLYASVGAAYQINKDVALQLEWEHAPTVRYEGLDSTMNRIALGIRFGF